MSVSITPFPNTDSYNNEQKEAKRLQEKVHTVYAKKAGIAFHSRIASLHWLVLETVYNL